MTNITYTDAQINFIKEKRKQQVDWNTITKQYNNKFKDYKTKKALQVAFDKYGDINLSETVALKNVIANRSVAKAKNKIAKENRMILDYLNSYDDLIDKIKDTLKSVKFTKPKIVKPKYSKKKKNMTQEIMITDVHYGKKTKTVDHKVIRERVRQLADVAISELDRYSTTYNVHRIVCFLGGDILENADFHGKESTKCSEFGTNEQIVIAVMSLYEDLIAPIAATGRPIDIPAVTGNHDRDDESKTYHYPGRYHKTFIIYKMLEYLCKLAGFSNVNFIIPDGVYCTLQIYNDIVLYEHLDNVSGGLARNSLYVHMSKRSAQINQIIKYLRGGHYHELTMFGRGRVIVGPSIPGQDSFSDIKGYDSEPGAVINYYVQTDNRPDSYYHSFPVYLG